MQRPRGRNKFGTFRKETSGAEARQGWGKAERQITQGLVTVRSFNFILVYQEATKYLPRGVM